MNRSLVASTLFLLLSATACNSGETPPPATAETAAAGSAAPAAPAAADTAAATPASSTEPAAPPAPAAPAAPAELAVGSPAPAFSATASDGKKLDLAQLKGKPVVVYFYPKDETPGCTKEACSFRDEWKKLAKTGVVLIGVSADTDESHKKFAAHHKLPFHLVSDADGKLAKSFGVGNMERQSFVIGADGNVKKIYRTVDVKVHAKEILSDLK